MIEREEAIETEDARKLDAEQTAKEMLGQISVKGREGAVSLRELAQGFQRLRDGAEGSHRVAEPRAWAALLGLWWELLLALAVVVGATPEDLRGPRETRSAHDLHLRVWRWMWTLPPCSEARKAAFTLGHAAMMIDRWRSAPTCEHIPSHVPDSEPIGQRAEALLRILRWHIDDARGEASAGDAAAYRRPLPSSERIYVHEEAWGTLDPLVAAERVLNDHVEHRREDRARLARIISRTGRTDLVDAFAKTAIASLPEAGGVTMTSADVVRFASMLLDDAEPAKAVSP